jgi:hypothetical protein
VIAMNLERFRSAADRVMNLGRVEDGIGTLSEQTAHAVLKHYYADPEAHEIPVGPYIADIMTPSEIIEIQTRNLRSIQPKLERFLSVSAVRLVHPIVLKKRIVTIDLSAGTISKPKTSPKRLTLYAAFLELATIRSLLSHPNFRCSLVLLQMDEIRKKNDALSKSSIKIDHAPTALLDELEFNQPSDFLRLLPNDLAAEFISADIAKRLKIRQAEAQAMLLVLTELRLVERIGKRERYWLYRRSYQE